MFNNIVSCCSGLASIITLLCLVLRPIRERLLGIGKISEAQKCMLRQQILSTYYHHKDENHIRQHERENLDKSYAAYKAMGGNSFVDDIYREMRKWTVES